MLCHFTAYFLLALYVMISKCTSLYVIFQVFLHMKRVNEHLPDGFKDNKNAVFTIELFYVVFINTNLVNFIIILCFICVNFPMSRC